MLTTSLALTRVGSSTAAESAKVKALIADSRLGLLSFTAADGDGDEDDSGGSVVEIKYH